MGAMRFSAGQGPIAAAVSPEACRGDRAIGPEPRESLWEGEGQARPHFLPVADPDPPAHQPSPSDESQHPPVPHRRRRGTGKRSRRDQCPALRTNINVVLFCLCSL